MPHGITQCYLPPGRGDIPAVSPADGHLTIPTVAELPALCEIFLPTASLQKLPQFNIPAEFTLGY